MVQISSHLPTYIYTCVLCTHLRVHICRDLVHLAHNSSGPPGVSSRPLGSRRVPHVQCVCVCVYTHMSARTLPPTSKIEKTQDNNDFICPSVENNPPRQETSALTIWNPLASSSNANEQTVHTRVHVHTLQRLCRKYVCWCQKRLFWSPALVRPPSSLSMVCARSLATGLTHHKFSPFFSRISPQASERAAISMYFIWDNSCSSWWD